MKVKTQQPKPVGHYKSSAKKKVHNNTGISLETRKKSKATRKGRNGEPQS